MTSFDEKYYQSNRQLGNRPALGYYARLAKKYLSPVDFVLDFGCGTGWFMKRLSSSFQVSGFETSQFARAEALRINPGTQVYERTGEIPGNSFSGIMALHVFEHIADYELVAVLAELRHALTISGRLICVMPQLEGRGHRLKGLEWAGFKDVTHINLKTAEQWTEIFKTSGFRVVRAGTDGLWDYPYSNMPKILDLLFYSIGTVVQFMCGILLLPVSQGESLILILEKDTGFAGSNF